MSLVAIMEARYRLLEYSPHRAKESKPHLAQEHLDLPDLPTIQSGPSVVKEITRTLTRVHRMRLTGIRS